MPYRTLGSRKATGAADTTGTNPGNWTVTFDPGLLNVTIPEFEVYKIIVGGAGPTATFNVFVDAQQWDTAVYAVHNSWDPTQPLLVRSGQYLYFYYSTPSTDGNQPSITVWLRYDVTLTDVFAGLYAFLYGSSVMGWQTEVIAQLLAGNTIINASGDFVYDGTPGAGNLIIALAPAAGTDSFGNAFVKGVQVGKATDNSQVKLLPGAGGSSLVQFTIPALSLSNIPNLAGGPVAGTFAELLVSGPAMAGGGQNDWVQIIEFSNDTAGTFARGELRYIDTSGTAHVLLDWGKSDQAVHIPAGGGPFISAETFHDVSGGSGNTCRVKKVPWNGIWLDFEGSWAGVATTNMGSLPDATYYPTQARHFPVSSNAANAQNAAVFVPTSGALQLVTKGGTGSGVGGCSVVYPTN